jgi:hypothetical protein
MRQAAGSGRARTSRRHNHYRHVGPFDGLMAILDTVTADSKDLFASGDAAANLPTAEN